MITSAATPSSRYTRRYWLATLAATVGALAVSLSASTIWRKQYWQFPHEVALGSYLFTFGMMMPRRPESRIQSWYARLFFALLYAVVGAVGYAMLSGD